jgi:hypothetical protein
MYYILFDNFLSKFDKIINDKFLYNNLNLMILNYFKS